MSISYFFSRFKLSLEGIKIYFMTVYIRDIAKTLEEIAPLSSQEGYDNSGLIVGDPQAEVKSALLTLDCTEEVVDEAIQLGANLIIAHHPIVFKGLKKLNGKNYVERTVIKAIKNDIAIYAAHTNLDNYHLGVNYEIANHLGIKNPSILAPTQNTLKKLVFYCPVKDVEKVSKAIFNAGGGNIGNYSECSFETSGEGYFLPNESANPSIGKNGKREKVAEKRVEILISSHKENAIIQAMLKAHPYEEVAYDLYPITNFNQDEGAGMIGELEKEVKTEIFLGNLKKNFNCGCIRHTKLTKKKIKKVAFCGGSGSFLLADAKQQNADIYITSDFKYHEFFDAEDQIIIADIGHYESEQFTSNLILSIMRKNFINFAFYLSKVNTNPINYF